jgi:GT2 family glycosyltransferase
LKTPSKLRKSKLPRRPASRGKRSAGPATTASPPIVIAGMHRSGTSLVASIVSNLGVSLGDNLVKADSANKRGYFEDVDFLALNREMLAAATRPADGGYPDWGWTESEKLDTAKFAGFRRRAADLVAARTARNSEQPGWGWKEPRTTLALDFWDALVSEARYVLVYRHPWEVADSMQRLGADVFLRRPDYAWRIWAFYNRRLLDFRRRHPERTLLISSNAARRDPKRLTALFQEGLGLRGAKPRQETEELLDPELFETFDRDDPLIRLTMDAYPDCAELLMKLDRAADLPGSELWSKRPGRRGSARSKPAKAPRLSVVIPCYNQGDYLLEAVASVERSGEAGREVIIVNDGSDDPHTKSFLDLLRRRRYRIIDQKNSGLAAARNTGIKAARGEYVLPLDADNRLRTGFVTAALQVLDRRPKVGIVYGDRRDFGLRNGLVRVRPFDLRSLLACNYIDACAVMRKEVWNDCGGYDDKMPVAGLEDWDLWIAAARRNWQFHHLPIAAFDYRVRPDSMSAALTNEQHQAATAYIVQKHRDLYRKHLPKILAVAQQASVDLVRLRVESDQSRHGEADRNGRVLLLQSQFDEKARHVLQLQHDLEEKTNQVFHFKADAEEKARHVSLLQREIEERIQQVAHFKNDAEEKAKHIALLQRETEEKTGQVLHFQSDTEEKARHIALLQRDNDEKAKQVLHFQSDAEEKATHIALLQRDNEEKAGQILHFQKDAAEKTKHIALLQRDNEEKAGQILHFQKDAAEKAKHIALLQRDNEEKAGQILRFQQDVEEKVKHIALLESENADKTAQVLFFKGEAEENAGHAAEFQRESWERAKHVALLLRENAEKANQVAAFKADTEEKARHIALLTRENEEKTGQVFHFQRDLEEKARHIELLTRENEEKTQQVRHFQGDVEEKARHIALLLAENEEKTRQVGFFKGAAEERGRQAELLLRQNEETNKQLTRVRRQADDLARDLAELEARLASFQAEARDQAERIRELQEDVENKSDQIAALERERHKQRDLIEQANRELARNEERLERTKQQWADTKWAVFTLRKQLLQQIHSAKTPSARILKLQNEAQVAQSERDQLHSMVRALQEHVDQERLRVLTTEEAYRVTAERLQKTAKQLRSGQKQIERLTGRLILPFGKRQRRLRELVNRKGENV